MKTKLTVYKPTEHVGASKIVSLTEVRTPVHDGSFDLGLTTKDGKPYSWHASKAWMDEYNPQIGGYFIEDSDENDFYCYLPADAFEALYAEVGKKAKK